MLEIRLAAVAESEAVRAFYHALIDEKQADPCFPPWEKGVYPSDAMLASAIAAQTLYVGVCGGELAAAMVVNGTIPSGYAEGAWQVDAAPAETAVLHLLATAPRYMRRGLATEMVTHALKTAREQGKRVIRLDAWSGNAPAHALYRSLGFGDAGEMREAYADGSVLAFRLFEYPLCGGNGPSGAFT